MTSDRAARRKQQLVDRKAHETDVNRPLNAGSQLSDRERAEIRERVTRGRFAQGWAYMRGDSLTRARRSQ